MFKSEMTSEAQSAGQQFWCAEKGLVVDSEGETVFVYNQLKMPGFHAPSGPSREHI